MISLSEKTQYCLKAIQISFLILSVFPKEMELGSKLNTMYIGEKIQISNANTTIDRY